MSQPDTINPLAGSGRSADSGGSATGDLSKPAFHRLLLWLFLVGVIIRAVYLIEHARDPSFGVMTLDEKYYDTVARMLLAGEDLHPFHGLRPLLYPMFLAAIYKISPAHGIDLAIMTQHLLGVLTGLLVAVLGARVFCSRWAGIAAGVIYLLAPIPLNFEGEILIESSYVFLVCVGLWLVIQAVEAKGSRSAWLWFGAGCYLMLVAQARPNILIFLGVIPLFAGWKWLRERQAGWWPLLGLAGALVMGIPWGFVNKLQSPRFQIIPAAGGVNLYFGNKRTADGMVPEQERRVTYGERYEDSGEVWAREEYEAAMLKAGRQPDSDPMAVSRFWSRRAMDEIKAAPVSWLRLMVKKCWLMSWHEEIPNNKAFAFQESIFPVLHVLPARWVLLFMLAPLGVAAAFHAGHRGALMVVVSFILLYSAGNIAFFICDRYRYPIWPAMAVLAGGGLMATIGLIKLRRWAKLILPVTVMGLAALVSLPNWFHARLPTFERDYVFHSMAWYERGFFPEALEDVNLAVALDPAEITALNQRGNVLLAMQKFQEARQDYEKTLTLIADDAGIWNNYAQSLEGLGRTNDAMAAFGRATNCHPPSVSAFVGLAMDQYRLGQLDEALRTLDHLDKAQSKPNAAALVIRASIARQRGELREAADLEGQARRLDAGTAKWAAEELARK